MEFPDSMSPNLRKVAERVISDRAAFIKAWNITNSERSSGEIFILKRYFEVLLELVECNQCQGVFIDTAEKQGIEDAKIKQIIKLAANIEKPSEETSKTLWSYLKES